MPASMASENNQTLNNPDTPLEVEIVETAEASKGRLKLAVWRHFSRELKDRVVLAKCPDCKLLLVLEFLIFLDSSIVVNIKFYLLVLIIMICVCF